MIAVSTSIYNTPQIINQGLLRLAWSLATESSILENRGAALDISWIVEEWRKNKEGRRKNRPIVLYCVSDIRKLSILEKAYSSSAFRFGYFHSCCNVNVFLQFVSSSSKNSPTNSQRKIAKIIMYWHRNWKKHARKQKEKRIDLWVYLYATIPIW